MELNPIFMERCLQLALKGEGFTMPNPMVGAVIVHKGKIIGEGYHHRFGEQHAEVHAINSVRDQSLLKESTLYVSLEPCSHKGKTPPCANFIVSKEIPNVVIAVRDPNPKVSGGGVEVMRKNGIVVAEGVLEEEARNINRIFFVNQIYSRPYVILKWAQSKDGFIDQYRTPFDNKLPTKISNRITHIIAHKYRTRVQGIIVGTNTAILDNPQLTSRKWYGESPTRIVIDREKRIPLNSSFFDGSVETIVFTSDLTDHKYDNYLKSKMVKIIELDFTKDTNCQILNHLYNEKIYSLIVEGGTVLLSSFIDKYLWDEAVIERSEKMLYEGVKAPVIEGVEIKANKYLNSTQFHLKSKITRNIL